MASSVSEYSSIVDTWQRMVDWPEATACSIRFQPSIQWYPAGVSIIIGRVDSVGSRKSWIREDGLMDRIDSAPQLSGMATS